MRDTALFSAARRGHDNIDRLRIYSIRKDFAHFIRHRPYRERAVAKSKAIQLISGHASRFQCHATTVITPLAVITHASMYVTEAITTIRLPPLRATPGHDDIIIRAHFVIERRSKTVAIAAPRLLDAQPLFSPYFTYRFDAMAALAA